MAQLALIDAYQAFMTTAQPFVRITSEEGYEAALDTLEQVLESASDTEDEPLNPLIDMLSHAIEAYEAQDNETGKFTVQADNLPIDIALLRTLMRQHNLTGSDLPEVGDKTMVSKVLNGKRVLNRSAIEKLSDRFGLRPAMFFE